MLTQRIAKSLSDTVSNLTGCKFDPMYVVTDRNRVNYFPSNSLHLGRPLIITNFMGRREIIIPSSDWDVLCKREISIRDYVNTSVWYYGYYWGVYSLQAGGIHWQSLEDGEPGIRDKEKVKRYLTILKCRAYQQHNEEPPMMIWCSDCYLEKCPMSVIYRKRNGATWDEEVQERRVRKEFYDLLNKKLTERFGLELCALGLHKSLDGMPKTIYLSRGFSSGTAKVFISESMFIDMMYYPEKYDIEQMIEDFDLVACEQEYDENAKDFLPTKTMLITNKIDISAIKEFWAKE